MMQAAPPRNPNFPQKAEVLERVTGPNFTLAQVGKIAELGRYGIRHPLLGATISGKVFLQQVLDLTAMEISYGIIPPQTSIPFYHKHKQNEEVYLFLSGVGECQIDGEIVPIREGTAVRIAPEGVRAARNTGDEPMFYIVIQAKAGSLEQWTSTDGVGVPGEVTWEKKTNS
ncbi:MAG: cupin domain-containing protein [Planctomycetaceae bacterium]